MNTAMFCFQKISVSAEKSFELII